MADKIIRIATDDAPAPAGHYAQATAWRDLGREPINGIPTGARF